MSDEIFIENIEVFAKHGIHDGEKLKPQRFLISICAEFDGAAAKISDEISHTVDYVKLLEIITDAAQNSSFNLIERLAQHIADTVFSASPKVTAMRVRIAKFPDNLAGKRFSNVGFSSRFTRNGK
jgi:dihydroneopterin aldolase